MKQKPKNIKVYGAERCQKTLYYMNYLDEKGYDYDFYDVKENREYAEELINMYESRKLNFPTLVVNGKKLRNPRTYELEKWLAKTAR